MNDLILLLMSIALILSGVIQFLYPVQFYMFGKRWIYRDRPKLSKGAIGFERLIGLLIVVTGIIFFMFLVDTPNFPNP